MGLESAILRLTLPLEWFCLLTIHLGTIRPARRECSRGFSASRQFRSGAHDAALREAARATAIEQEAMFT